jgi:hypothetical protein
MAPDANRRCGAAETDTPIQLKNLKQLALGGYCSPSKQKANGMGLSSGKGRSCCTCVLSKSLGQELHAADTCVVITRHLYIAEV